MKFNPTKIAGIFLLALTVMIAGCGDDDNPTEPTTLEITSINPTQAMVGESVTISGSGFSTTTSQNTVTFTDNVTAQVTSASSSELVVTVPQGAANGPITVAVAGETASSQAFTVSEEPAPEIPAAYQDLPGELIAEDETWASDTVITGPRFILPGVTLTVEAGVEVSFEYHDNNADEVGTIITLPGDADNFSEARPSGRLVAQGEANSPIVFTSERKRVASWGGIILAGEASNNIPGGLGEIEGLSQAVQYGADINGGESFKDDDDSGVLSYVRIEYSGYSIDEGSELQALTLYSVGNGTQIDHISLYQSVDDGVELFGGTVDIKYLVAIGAQDDTFDYDVGWSGRGQFWLGLQTPGTPSNRGFENDGCDDQADCDGGNGRTNPQIYNVTIIGNDVANGETINGIHLREGITGTYSNLIIANFGKSTEYPIFVADDGTRDRIGNELTFEGNVEWNNANTVYNSTVQTGWTAQLGLQNFDPQFVDPVAYNYALQSGSQALTSGVLPPDDGWFDQVEYSGAFGEEDWTQEGTWVRFN